METAYAIECKCRWYREADVAITRTQAEVIADRHEAQDYRRPYRHETTVVEEVR